MIMNTAWLGVDTGGTFTDFVYFNGESVMIHKVLSTPSAPERAILQGVQELGLSLQSLRLVHGSTVATNAMLEGKGVHTVYITNQGFGDVLQIGRQARQELYNLQPPSREPLIHPDDCLEMPTRLSAQGELLETLDEQSLDDLRLRLIQIQPQAVAINLLFSFLDNRQERQIADCVPDGVFVSCSSDVLPEYKEYERGMTTCLNAYVGPLMAGYLQRLAQGMADVSISVMQSAGGTISAEQAGQNAVRLLLSGPAGGLKGAQYVAGLSHCQQLLTFDMGGTSTDVAVIDGDINLTSEGCIGHYPVAVPMVDMHTIGAGGGSIAQVDAGGMLLVGPESAGAFPGPACYGLGGLQATVTDANLVLGRLQADAFLGGDMRLDLAAARRAVASVAETLEISVEAAAEGIIRVANEHMVRALRVMSVQRGSDPREFVLASFGGAGGLHVCALAEALEMKQAMVPVHAGVLSALGMLVAAPSREMSQTHTRLLQDCSEAELVSSFKRLEQKARQEMSTELKGQSVQVDYSVDCRYQGQSFTLDLPWTNLHQLATDFHALHDQRYGHSLDIAIELVNLRVSVKGQSPSFQLPLKQSSRDVVIQPQYQTDVYGVSQSVPVYQRDDLLPEQELLGPALIVEKVSTTFVAEHWSSVMDQSGSLLLQYRGSEF